MEQTHIIHKVVIEVTVNNRKKAEEIKDDISSFLTMDVFPKLEKHFHAAQATLSDRTLQISRLTLDVNQSESSLNTALKDNIITSFQKELAEMIKGGPTKTDAEKEELEISLLGEEEKLLLTFLYFIENGALPWWQSKAGSAAIFETDSLQKIISAKTFAAKMSQSLQKPKIRERIINQFTDAQIAQFCQAVIHANRLPISLKNPVIKRLVKASFADRKAIWTLLFYALTEAHRNYGSGSTYENEITEQIIRLLPQLEAAKKQETEVRFRNDIKVLFPFIKSEETFQSVHKKNNSSAKKSAKKDHRTHQTNAIATENRKPSVFKDLLTDLPNDNTVTEATGYQVQNAGLVLLHPFIPTLFKKCNLSDPDGKKLVDPETAIHLLHYIATGETNQPESHMLFEKFLCGMPLHQTINRHIKLSRKHKSEANKVIEAVQHNWSSMQTSSVSLLQHEFFQRPGKLEPDNQLLTIERKTQDILLDKLSWGIGMIKLPWQSQFIFVNW